MPRKVDPKWGVDGVFIVERPERESQAPSTVLNHFQKPLTENEAKTILSEIKAIRWRYLKWKSSGSNVATRAEARNALEQLHSLNEISAGKLNALNPRASSELFDELCKCRELALSGDPNRPGIALLDVLLGGAALIVECDHAPGGTAQVCHDEPDPWIEFAGMPLDLGDDAAGLGPACGPIAEARVIPAHVLGRSAETEESATVSIR